MNQFYSQQNYSPQMQQYYGGGFMTGMNQAYLEYCKEILRHERFMMKEARRDRDEELRSKAFSSIIANSGQMLVKDKRGNYQLLMDEQITEVYHLIPDELFRDLDLYFVFFAGKDSPMIINDKILMSSPRLVGAIQENTNKTVNLLPTEKRSADLLRQRILTLAKVLHVEFYGGWKRNESGWVFVLRGGSTHWHRAEKMTVATQQKALPETTPVGAWGAANQMFHLMQLITNPDLRDVIILLVHTASLTTLLNESGYRQCMGISFYSSEPQVLRFLEKILCWFGDPTIKLSGPASRLVDQVVERKDQPAVFTGVPNKDARELLHEMVITGEVVLDKKNGKSVPFNSFPVLLSADVGGMAMSGDFATLDIGSADIQGMTVEEVNALCKYVSEYLLGFTGYVSDHLDTLLGYVAQSIYEVPCICDGLSGEAMNLLGAFLGVKHIVADYCQSVAPGMQLATEVKNLDVPDVLLRALEHSSAAELCDDDLVQTFIQAVYDLQAKNAFDIRPVEGNGDLDAPCAEGMIGIVYMDDEFLSFTNKAFRAVCAVCGTSVPALARALKVSSLLQGAAANQETMKTRITIRSGSKTKRELVYKFDLSVFD